jgi:hypothetical protein
MHGLAHGPKLESIELIEAVQAPVAQLLNRDHGLIEQAV